jgi:hypothetical protein
LFPNLLAQAIKLNVEQAASAQPIY